MMDTERELRKAVYGLFRIVRMNACMKKAQKEFSELLEYSDFALAMFESVPGSEKMNDAKEQFDGMIVKVKDVYGQGAISAAYASFKTALDDADFLKSLGLCGELSLEEKKNLFSRAFEKVTLRAENWNEDDDFYSYFIETVKEIIMPTKEKNTETEDTCPYCDGAPKRIAKAEFFGPHSAQNDGYVWGCECGAYAEMDENGNVIGKLGDTVLHQKRNLVKGAICELCSIAGLTTFESYRWFSLVTGMRIESIADVEYLDLAACNAALRLFLYVKQNIGQNEAVYPKDRNELFLFFVDGGRLLVCNAYGFSHGKLLIPGEIGPDGIRVQGMGGMQSISFSPTLDYEFKGDELYILHPSGKKEKFRMLPASVRSKLFEIREEDFLPAKAG